MKSKRSRNSHKKSLLPLLILLVIVLVGVGVLVYQALRTQSGNPIINSQDDVPRISAAEAYRAYTNGEAVLVDTRAPAYYQQGHAAGAINIPLGELESRLKELDPEQWYITYCT